MPASGPKRSTYYLIAIYYRPPPLHGGGCKVGVKAKKESLINLEKHTFHFTLQIR
jgi:hypothetical protein